MPHRHTIESRLGKVLRRPRTEAEAYITECLNCIFRNAQFSHVIFDDRNHCESNRQMP